MDILGTSFSIAADEEPAYLENLLNRYHLMVDSTRKVTGLTDPLKIAIVTGFLLCDEIQKLHEERNAERSVGHISEESEKVEAAALDLIARIDEALDKKPLIVS
jgi:cell division protein ZapA (FtsZ GTPase activity inhibitor)